MQYFSITLLCFFTLTCSLEQSNTPTTISLKKEKKLINIDSAKIYTVVDEIPRFPGCESDDKIKKCANEEFLKYVYKNLRMSTINKNDDFEYKIVSQFVVEKNGTISNIQFIRGAKTALRSNLLDVLKEMPKWIPGRLNNEPQRVQMTIPFGLHYE